jgi:hypothetical protein
MQHFLPKMLHLVFERAPFAVTGDPVLWGGTEWVVLVDRADTIEGSVFRKSTSAPGLLSRDLHAWVDGHHEHLGKDREKYRESPAPPATAFNVEIDGVDFYTMCPMTAEEIDRLHRLNRRLIR